MIFFFGISYDFFGILNFHMQPEFDRKKLHGNDTYKEISKFVDVISSHHPDVHR